MKKNGILNSEISKLSSDLGHTDQITIGDAGLPVPDGFKKIDLALKLGTPSFIEVLEEVLKDMAVEKFILAEEITTDNKTQLDAIQSGIGFLTENRKDEGLILDESIRENISLPSIDGFNKNLVVDRKAENEFTNMLGKRLGVRAANFENPVSSLSGGNQQKVVLAKWVGIGSKVLILDEPTRGVDVGAKREIYQLMNELAERGVAIIMVSSDLPEILGISDRVIVVHEGHIAGELTKEEATEEGIMTLATGGY